MKLKRQLCILPALAGIVLALPGCVITETGYYEEPVVSTGFALTYGNGYRGPGYYYGPPNLGYYSYGPGIIYYQSRAHVPHHHWRRYHGGQGHGGHHWDRHRPYRRY